MNPPTWNIPQVANVDGSSVAIIVSSGRPGGPLLEPGKVDRDAITLVDELLQIKASETETRDAVARREHVDKLRKSADEAERNFARCVAEIDKLRAQRRIEELGDPKGLAARLVKVDEQIEQARSAQETAERELRAVCQSLTSAAKEAQEASESGLGAAYVAATKQVQAELDAALLDLAKAIQTRLEKILMLRLALQRELSSIGPRHVAFDVIEYQDLLARVTKLEQLAAQQSTAPAS